MQRPEPGFLLDRRFQLIDFELPDPPIGPLTLLRADIRQVRAQHDRFQSLGGSRKSEALRQRDAIDDDRILEMQRFDDLRAPIALDG